jgi:Reverse transcriptase (RNA-dependent DNA polymerase)
MLETNPYGVVHAIDFSKAFDTVRHSELPGKYSRMELSNYVVELARQFFRANIHCSRYAGVESEFISISAGIIQGSATGPVSYVVTGSDLRPLTCT